MTNATLNSLPRNEKLPLFNPHVAAYICAPVALPPFDAQADAWFREARALEDPEIYINDRDYKKIVSLTRQAAERQHWKAMLNLASFILERREPPHDEEDAIQLVEAAMKMGVPAAYDRMGTFYMNGTGVKADATRAYSFWQQAAKMGSPEALSDLGRKMFSLDDRPGESRWANSAVGIKMLECAYGQGYGPAAYELGYLYSNPMGREAIKEELHLALLTWHNGVKLGSAGSAAAISIEFDRINNIPARKVAHPDIARSERYGVLGRILEFHPDYRLPNLDSIVPLPPADLPAWNGDGETLLDAARGVSHPPSAPQSPSEASTRKGRYFLGPEYRLLPTDDITSDATAPFTGYWEPFIDGNQLLQGNAGKPIHPGLYQVGERFEHIALPRTTHAPDGDRILRWRNWRTVRHDQGTVSPPVVSGRTRSIAPPIKPRACAASERCPVTGSWQPWMHAEHPLQDAVNQYWRQTWLVAGQPFPDPQVAESVKLFETSFINSLVSNFGDSVVPG